MQEDKSTTITFISSLPPLKGGISQYSHSLVSAIAQKHAIECINFKQIYPEFLYPGGTVDDSISEPDIEGAIIHRSLTWYNPFTWLRVGLFSKGRVIHLQWWAYPLAVMYIVIMISARFRRKRVILTVHNTNPHEVNFFSKLANASVLWFAHEYIVHTKDSIKQLREKQGVAEKKIHFVPMGIISPPITNITATEARKKIGLNPEDKVMLIFGNIRKYKGVDVAIESLEKIKSEIEEVKLLIVGKVWGDWEYYQKLIEKKGLQDNIMLVLDYVPDKEVEWYFKSSDIVILPYTHFDAQSAVGSLALKLAKPMIVSRVGGLPDLVAREEAISKPNDATELASKVIAAFRNKELLREMSKDTARIASLRDWNKIADITVDIYEDSRN